MHYDGVLVLCHSEAYVTFSDLSLCIEINNVVLHYRPVPTNLSLCIEINNLVVLHYRPVPTNLSLCIEINNLVLHYMQASTYEQDFAKEREDRQSAHGEYQSQIEHLTHQLEQFMLDATQGNRCVQCNQQRAEWRRAEAAKNEEIRQLREQLETLIRMKKEDEKELAKLRDIMSRMKKISSEVRNGWLVF